MKFLFIPFLTMFSYYSLLFFGTLALSTITLSLLGIFFNKKTFKYVFSLEI